jgi:hypothetical protein
VDNSESFVEAIGARASEAGLKNVVPVLSQARSNEIPPGSPHLVFMADTYHHLSETKSVISA